MRYFFSMKHMTSLFLLGGSLVASLIFFSSPAFAIDATYTVSDDVITIKNTAYGTATFQKGKTTSGFMTCSTGVGTTSSTVQLQISQELRQDIDSGGRPSSLQYSALADSPSAPSDCRKGGVARYGSATPTADSREEVAARQTAMATTLLAKVPELKNDTNVRGKLLLNDVDGAVAECINVAYKKSTPASSMGNVDGTQDIAASTLNQHFADCYSEKSGTPASQIKSLLDAQGNPIAEANAAGEEARSDAAQEDRSCGSEVEGIGWVVCPIINAVTGLNDDMWNIIEKLLVSDPLRQDGGPYYSLWAALRNIANALLVIVFVVIVYAQVTNVAVSNYGVKKMLPRLVVVAIAINLSYFIVSIAVDLFNLLGSSLKDLIDSEFARLGKAEAFNWGGLVGLILGGTGFTVGVGVAFVLSGGGTTMFLLLLPSALMGLIGFLAALVTLMFRQAVIPLLAIMAPLAFVAYIFPNTESIFIRWRKMFFAMLLLYPMAAVLFSGMKLAGMLIAMGGGGQGEVFALLTGLIVMSVPLFMLPFLASKSGAMISSLNGKLQGWGGNLRKPVGEWSKGKAALSRAKYDSQGLRYRTKKDGSRGGVYLRDRLRGMRRGSQYRKRRDEVLANAYEKQAGADFSDEFATRSGGVVDDMSGSPVAQAYVRAAGTAGATMKSQAAEEEVKQLVTEFKSAYGSTGLGAAKDEMIKAVTAGDVARARAMQQYLMGAGSAGALHLNEVYSDTDVTNSLAAPGAQGKDLYDSLGADALGGSIKNKSAAIDKYFTQNREGANFRSFSTLKDDASTYNALSGSSLATQADLDHLVTENKITPDSARAILDSTTVSEVGVATRAKLENKAPKRKPQEVVVIGGGAGQGTSSTGAP